MSVAVSTSATLVRREPATHPVRPRISGDERRQLTGDLFARACREAAGQREETLQHIVVLHVSTARSIASRYRDRGVDLDDLEQAACVALVQAVRRYVHTTGHEFLAYAVPTIRGALRRHFRDFGWMVRPPRTVQELQPKLGAYEFERDPDNGRPLTMEQVAQRLDTTAAAVREAAQASGCFTPASLDAPADPFEVRVRADRLHGRGDPGFEAAEARAVLAAALTGLSARDRRLLQMRFVDDRTQQDMADELGLTQTKVSRTLAGILGQLRELLTGQPADLHMAGFDTSGAPT